MISRREKCKSPESSTILNKPLNETTTTTTREYAVIPGTKKHVTANSLDLLSRELASLRRENNNYATTSARELQRSDCSQKTNNNNNSHRSKCQSDHSSHSKSNNNNTQCHSPNSPHSSSSTPPAPALCATISPASLNLNSSTFIPLNSISPTKVNRTDELFVMLHKTNASPNKVESSSPMLASNGWHKESVASNRGFAKCLSELNHLDVPTGTAATSPNPNTNSSSPSPMLVGNEPLAQLLITLKEQNKSLIREIEDLRIKLEDAEGDLKLVRCQMRSMSKHIDSVVHESNRDRMVDESILGELEFYKEKVLVLERDIQSLLDEKEELIIAKDDLSMKNERLNEHLLSVMRDLSGKSDNYPEANSLPYDVDALFLENRYLNEQIKNDKQEKQLLLDRLAKYKDLMDQHQRSECSNKKKQYFSDDERNSNLTTLRLPGGHVVSARDVERLIRSNTVHSMEATKSNQLYLWNLLVALFEGLQVKNMNLYHARKTNRMLLNRVQELEIRLHKEEVEDHASKLRSSKSPTKFTTRTTRNTATAIAEVAGLHNQEDLLTPDDALETGTDCNLSVSMTKETSDQGNDELSSTGDISTPSTTRQSLRIEQHLQALQNDALSDSLPSHSNLDSFSSIAHHHHHHSSRSPSDHRYEFRRDFDSHESPPNSLFN